MVNIHLARNGERQAIVIAVPRAGSRRASAVCHDVAAVTLQNGFSGVASAADGDPVVEEVAVVRGRVVLGFDGELR